MGKLSFFRLRDLEADIQVQLKADTTKEEDYEFFNDFNNNHKNILNSVNSNIDLYQQLLEKLTSIEDNNAEKLLEILKIVKAGHLSGFFVEKQSVQ